MLVDEHDGDVGAGEEALEGGFYFFFRGFCLVRATVVDDQEVGLAFVVALADAGQQEAGDCVVVSDNGHQSRRYSSAFCH